MSKMCTPFKLGPHDAWFIFVMRHASWFAHRVYKKMCLIWVDVSLFHSSHLVRQLGGKLTHQSKLYVSNSTNLFDLFTHDTYYALCGPSFTNCIGRSGGLAWFLPLKWHSMMAHCCSVLSSIYCDETDFIYASS